MSDKLKRASTDDRVGGDAAQALDLGPHAGPLEHLADDRVGRLLAGIG